MTTADWINLTIAGAVTPPPAAFGSNLAYDPVGQEYVYFGGGSFSSVLGNQTWVFAHGLWQNETNFHDAPPARTQGAMDFDANAGAVLLFGGQGTSGYLSDTWSWSAGVWTNLSAFSAAVPTARATASLAFDGANDTNASILFGGFSATGVINDTWIWQPGSGWTQLAPTASPSPREFSAMGYDASLAALVLFGGRAACTSGVCDSAETWEWYSGSWWKILSPSSPSGRYGAFFSGDPAAGEMLLFGGYNATNTSYLADSWSFAGSAWAKLSPADHPSARFIPTGAPETAGSAPLLFSGTAHFGTDLGSLDTWTYEVAPAVTVTAPGSEVGAPAAVTVSLTGGTAPYSVSLKFGDGANGSAQTDTGAATLHHTYPDAGTYALSALVTDALGARTVGTSSITVTSGPVARISVAPVGTDVGKPLQFTEVTVASGTAPDQYSWNWADGTSSTGSSVSHSYGVAGTFRVQLNISDSAGSWSTSSLVVLVATDPAVQIASNPSQAVSGTPEILSAAVAGGTAPFTYSWSLGDGTWSTNPAPAHSFASSGTYTVYTVQVWVNDSAGTGAHAISSLTVGKGTPGSGGTGSGSSSSPPIPLWFLAGLGALAVVAIAGVVLLRSSPKRAAP
ncbi:MAG: PKD domain-containing protein [Thermoplasmata archaeon]|nr:PKD domain-containing protein [Thermoplasmata archaeon]